MNGLAQTSFLPANRPFLAIRQFSLGKVVAALACKLLQAVLRYLVGKDPRSAICWATLLLHQCAPRPAALLLLVA